MTRKHYQRIADILKEARVKADHAVSDGEASRQHALIDGIESDFIRFLSGDNPNFDAGRFKHAARGTA